MKVGDRVTVLGGYRRFQAKVLSVNAKAIRTEHRGHVYTFNPKSGATRGGGPLRIKVKA